MLASKRRLREGMNLHSNNVVFKALLWDKQDMIMVAHHPVSVRSCVKHPKDPTKYCRINASCKMDASSRKTLRRAIQLIEVW